MQAHGRAAYLSFATATIRCYTTPVPSSQAYLVLYEEEIMKPITKPPKDGDSNKMRPHVSGTPTIAELRRRVLLRNPKEQSVEKKNTTTK